MKILLEQDISPKGDKRIYYKFEGDVITATLDGTTDTFDFSGVPEGELELFKKETGESLIETTLSKVPILGAKKVGEVLYVRLLNYTGYDATEEERFPEWISAKDYVTPKEEEVDEDKGPVEEPGRP